MQCTNNVKNNVNCYPTCHIVIFFCCSLKCVKSHKKVSGCSGVRCKTKFLSINSFDDNQLHSGQFTWALIRCRVGVKYNNTNTFLDVVFQLPIQILLNCITITVAQVLHGTINYTWRTLVLQKFCTLNNICWDETSFPLCYRIFEVALKIQNFINPLGLVLQVHVCGGCRHDNDSAGSVVLLYYLRVLIWFTLKQLRRKYALYSYTFSSFNSNFSQ